MTMWNFAFIYFLPGRAKDFSGPLYKQNQSLAMSDDYSAGAMIRRV